MPSNLTGSDQPMHKIPFEEALQNSIESSLRSSTDTPSTVFSSLFCSYCTTDSNSLPEPSDVKPTFRELHYEVTRHNSDPVELETINQKPAEVASSVIPRSPSFPQFSRTTPNSPSHAKNENIRASPIFLSQPPSQTEENNAVVGTKLPNPLSQPQFLTQQQQLEKIHKARLEQQFKQLQRLQAWQQMQKEQSLRQRLPIHSSHVQEGIAAPIQTATGIVDTRYPPSNPVHHVINEFQSNTSQHVTRAHYTGRNDRPLVQSLIGFCKGGKDIRLASVERNANLMAPLPSDDFALLALQPNPSDASDFIIVAIKTNSMPPIQSSSQALLAQCIGCGENSLHTFAQLVEHIGLVATADILNSHRSSTLLMASYMRFYLNRDQNNPHILIRGPHVSWQNSDNRRIQQVAQLPAISMNSNGNPAAATLFRGKLTMVDAPNTNGTPFYRVQGTASPTPRWNNPVSVNPGSTQFPNLKRALSNPTQPHVSEPPKRQISNCSQDDMMEVLDDNSLEEHKVDEIEWKSIVVPNDLAVLKKKLVLAFMCPYMAHSELPSFIGDTTNIMKTSCFSDCFKKPSKKALMNLEDLELAFPCNGYFLLALVQYLISLGFKRVMSVEGLSCAITRAIKKLSQTASANEGLTMSRLLAVSQFAAATSNGLIEIIRSKISVVDAISQCIRSSLSSPYRYHIAVYLPDKPNEELSFHLLVSDQRSSRVLGESLYSNKERLSLIRQGINSLAYSQLCSLLSRDNMICHTSLPTSNLSISSSKQFRNISAGKQCFLQQKTNVKIASSLLRKVEEVYSNPKDVDLADFTSVRFVFLTPPNSILFSQTQQCLQESGVIDELHQTAIPAASFPSHFIVPMNASSTQRITSLCEQWKNSSTLLILLQMEAHSSYNSSEAQGCLNQSFITNSKNILIIQCSSSPYLLLTDASPILSSNLISCQDAYCCKKCIPTPLCLGAFSNRKPSFSISFDPMYESVKDDLLTRYYTIHTSLIACELLTQQYKMSLITSSASANNFHFDTKEIHDSLSTPFVNQMVQGLLSSCSTSCGLIGIVRIFSEDLASRFFDVIQQTRDELKLHRAFEVVLYSDRNQSISLSPHFLEILQIRRGETTGWSPRSLSDLAGIPCLVVYEGIEPASQPMPSTLKYVDLRMAFEGVGPLHRAKVEREISLAAPLCLVPVENDCEELKMKHSSDDGKGSSQVDDTTSTRHTWHKKDDENMKRGKNGSEPDRDESKSSLNQNHPEDSSVDFISLAMMEADLPSGDKRNPEPDQNRLHSTPIAVVPEYVYDVTNGDFESLTLSNLSPHPLTRWNESIHPTLTYGATMEEQVEFYKQWTTPQPNNPDHGNNEGTLDHKRILLITPPNSQPLLACSLFLLHLHRNIKKMLEVSVYNHKDDSTEVFENSFRTFISGSLQRGISQIANSFDDEDQLRSCIRSNKDRLGMDVATRECRNTLSVVKPLPRSERNEGNDTAQGCVSSTEYMLKTAAASGDKDGLYFRVIVPEKYLKNFRFSKAEDGTMEITALRLKLKNDGGLKTPVLSIGVHGPKDGLYNLSPGHKATASTVDKFLHMVIVKDCDAQAYKAALCDQIIVVLPTQFDYLGNGALKYASQVLFEHFFTFESAASSDPDLVWPFVLFTDDDVVAWSKWQDGGSGESYSQDAGSWEDISLLSVLEIMEGQATAELSALGFRPWGSDLTITSSQRQVLLNQGNCISSCYLESCLFLNLKSTSSVKFTRTRFENEDIDWSLRAAASGLSLLRFENIVMITKVMPTRESQLDLLNTSTTLVTGADSSFEPLHYHPALMLEKHLAYHGSAMFPSSVFNPNNPVLCLDCYVSLGTEVCVQFATTSLDVKAWAFNDRKKYGGLILPCIVTSINPELLQGLEFVKGAVVCVIGSDRSSLRQTVVNLNLEKLWHFRLTNEFQTANSQKLGCSRVRPFYFLTGLRKEGL